MTAPHTFKILMADDVVRYHKLYEFAIKDALPATVKFACDGREALSELESTPYDLLILDLNMPVMSGEEVLQHIRSNPTYDNMPVIILTGDSGPGTQKRLLEMGANDFIEKGSPPELFVARLKAQSRFKFTLDRVAQLAVDRDIFAAGVLHDIRNLETTIMAVADLGQNYLEHNPEQHREIMLQDFETLEKKAAHLGEYAAGIINMVRDTRTPAKYESLAFKPLIEWVQRIIKPATSAQDDLLQIEFTGEFSPVLADRNLLQLALLNILQNAVKYRRPEVSPAMKIWQETPQVSTPSKENRIVTKFQDNGKGIKRVELRKVFKPFVRGMNYSGSEGGFGLGLSLVAKVITNMNGYVWAELPEVGMGTIFCIDLPKG